MANVCFGGDFVGWISAGMSRHVQSFGVLKDAVFFACSGSLEIKVFGFWLAVLTKVAFVSLDACSAKRSLTSAARDCREQGTRCAPKRLFHLSPPKTELFPCRQKMHGVLLTCCKFR